MTKYLTKRDEFDIVKFEGNVDDFREALSEAIGGEFNSEMYATDKDTYPWHPENGVIIFLSGNHVTVKQGEYLNLNTNEVFTSEEEILSRYIVSPYTRPVV